MATKAKTEIRMVRLDQITLDPRLQCRAAGLDAAWVGHCTDLVKEGAQRPESDLPRVFDTGAALLLGDGWHWHEAHKQAGKSKMRCLISRGTYRDALAFAAGANAAHGLPRSGADRRRAVEVLLDDEEFGKLSSRGIAEMAHVSPYLVIQIRKERDEAGPGTIVGKDRKEYPASAPRPDPEPDQVFDQTPDDVPAVLAEPVAARGSAVIQGEPLKPEERRDGKGREIPADLLPVFLTSQEMYAVAVRELGYLQGRFEQMKSDSHAAAAFLNPQSVAIGVSTLQGTIKAARPYVVCPACSGTRTDGGIEGAGDCKLCRAHGKPQGFLPRGAWEQLTAEQREIAESFAPEKKGDAWEGD